MTTPLCKTTTQSPTGETLSLIKPCPLMKGYQLKIAARKSRKGKRKKCVNTLSRLFAFVGLLAGNLKVFTSFFRIWYNIRPRPVKKNEYFSERI